MRRHYFASDVSNFLNADGTSILGELLAHSEFSVETSQRDAWLEEIRILKTALSEYRGDGAIFFEYSIPRLGRRIDVVALLHHVVFVLEFKVGEQSFLASGLDQVWDYALDLKNFHETSHGPPVVPILIATEAESDVADVEASDHKDNLWRPLKCNRDTLRETIREAIRRTTGPPINPDTWEGGRYYPTPTIIEAATSLYSGHTVAEISRNDATAINLGRTSEAAFQIIRSAREKSRKAICFVTGVPGAGKTLVGLNIATQHIDKNNDLYSVFLSGNGPLVAILREALARDKVRRKRESGQEARKGDALSEVKLFIQNVHHFRDECLVDSMRPPLEHVALFDEAQRAWNREQTASFMRRKKKRSDFDRSEPEFLLSCLDRNPDWAVIVCLVGGGQEINTGEAGISEWIDSVERSFQGWDVFISPHLTDNEYSATQSLQKLNQLPNRIEYIDELHLAVSVRSFRSERVSRLVKLLLDLEEAAACRELQAIGSRYPIVLTRDLATAKCWLKQQARGSERYGIVVSSQAQRLKPHAIDVRSPMDPVHWFLDRKEDVRSSYYLEDVATEFHVQGLELDWACLTWDADFRYSTSGWGHWSFCGDKWKRVKKPERQTYLKNAYRVLLTRARQGMVIAIPKGDREDPTRVPAFYDATFDYLQRIGFPVI
jgi:hypothetical protein